MNLKFQNFLHDESIYINVEKYWFDLFEEYNSLLPLSEKWASWFGSAYGNGKKIMDGNPIFSQWNKDLRKGLRIIQEEFDAGQQHHLGAWMDKYDDEVDELVICCILTEESEAVIRRLIKAYVKDNFSSDEMKEFIEKELSV